MSSIEEPKQINPVYIVLHRPIYPRNIGMCARAVANYGFQRLILVGPQTELNVEAKQGAAHAQELLAATTIYASLDAFYAAEGEGIRIALSGKDARLKKSDLIEPTLESITSDIDHPIQNSATPVYLFFGAEDDGLSSEEMALCHYVCRIPTYSEVNSLNLSHAVLLVCFLVRRALEKLSSEADTRDGADIQSVALSSARPIIKNSIASAAASLQPAYFPKATIHRWLGLLGFDLSSPRVNIEKTLQRILLSQTPTPDELRTLDALLHQTIRKLEDREKSGSK